MAGKFWEDWRNKRKAEQNLGGTIYPYGVYPPPNFQQAPLIRWNQLFQTITSGTVGTNVTQLPPQATPPPTPLPQYQYYNTTSFAECVRDENESFRQYVGSMEDQAWGDDAMSGNQVLYGWKALRLDPIYKYLYSRHDGSIWKPGVAFEAKCVGIGRHLGWYPDTMPVQHLTPAAPGLTCRCGIHASIDPMGTYNYLGNLVAESGLVLVRVAMWGRVVANTKGYRAQYAYPQEIIAGLAYNGHKAVEDRITKVADMYGVPVFFTGTSEIGVAKQRDLARNNKKET